jgi:translation initiation factor 3 subunit E
MVKRRAEVVARLKSLEEAAAPLVAFLQNPQLVQEFRLVVSRLRSLVL